MNCFGFGKKDPLGDATSAQVQMQKAAKADQALQQKKAVYNSDIDAIRAKALEKKENLKHS